MNPNSKEFKTLQAKWYKKAAKSGFKDVEQLDGNLKTWASRYFTARYDLTRFEAEETYFRLAGQFLYEHEFSSMRDYRVWQLHSEGLYLSEISTEAKRQKVKLSKLTAFTIVKRLAKEMFAQYGIHTK